MSASPGSPERELAWLRRAAELSRLLALETDLRELLPLALEAAIELTEAERGFLVRVVGEGRSGPQVRVEVARGFNRTQLKGRAGDVSRTVVERVLASGRGLVTTREEDADVLGVPSVQARRVLSIICAPMRLRGQVRGVLYLDHRFRRDAFASADLDALCTLADQAALAIETAELRSEAARLGDAVRELEQVRVRSAGSEPPPAQEDAPRPRTVFGRLVGGSPLMEALFAQLERVARSTDPLLIQGEPGSGRGLVAAELHARSEGAGALCVQGCAAAAEAELEEALFGERRGRGGGRRGALERGGTVVLREVADLPLPLQARLAELLRARHDDDAGQGDDEGRCRIVATTAQDLRELARAGAFREDLLYRLEVQRIVVPPLRERGDDVLLLCDHFAELERGRPLSLGEPVRELLRAYSWPGNVLELKNEVHRLCALGLEQVSPHQLSPEIRAGRGVPRSGPGLSGKTLPEVEREMLQAALTQAGGNKARAARQLGIPRTSLYGLMERHGLA